MTDDTAITRAEAILKQDRRLSHRLGYALSPWIRGALTWLGVALAYDVVTGQWSFLPWHNVKAEWDGLIKADWWTPVRHLIRGLPEGVGFGIAKARGKNPVRKRRRAADRAAHLAAPTTADAVGKRAVLVLGDWAAAITTLLGTLAGGYLLIHLAGSPRGLSDAYWNFADFVTKITPGVPSAIRDAFSLSNPNEDVGRVAGLLSHTAGRSVSRGARKRRFEVMVQKYVKQILDGSLTRSRPWSGKGAAIHEAAERITAHSIPTTE